MGTASETAAASPWHPLAQAGRELGAWHPQLSCAPPLYRTPRWLGCHDLYAPGSAEEEVTEQGCWPPFYLRRRSRVTEVLAAGGQLLALAESGVCAAYHIGVQCGCTALARCCYGAMLADSLCLQYLTCSTHCK